MGTASEYTLRQIQTALEKIDDLQQALASVAGDELRVEVTGQPVEVVPDSGEKLFGFSDTVGNLKTNTNLSAGTNVIDHDPVPAGKVHVITNIYQDYRGTVPSSQGIAAVIDGVVYGLCYRVGAVFPNVYTWTGILVLGPGDYVRHTVGGATAGDDLYCRIVGYQFAAP